MDSIRVLTVCSGNICRSPLAQLMISSRLSGLDSFVVTSAGTVARDGDPMPDPAQELAIEYGVDPTTHRATYLTESIVSDSDLILAMSRSHRSQIVRYDPRKISRTFTLREFARLSGRVGDEEVRAVATAPDVRGRFEAVMARLVAEKAGAMPAIPDEDDVVDPYRKDRATYVRSGLEIAPAVEEVARVLRLAAYPLGGESA
ncbi:low molecular weight phosphatase family protein [Herbiconiux sp. A18JL235]|uniref:Low molecular weight phosphatase family protein n=1 Tax=Herbiconiux sp. A18JL235 TaxID=3152363 RepID=A0AB39BIW0_9MICO